jgi:glycosyltransferase involved in cell wall biosynthesis
MDAALDRAPSNVRFPGYVRDTPGAFAAGDVCFFPSQSETQGLVLLEAASLGKPLVVRDLEVYRDWLVHGENCLKGRSAAEFASHLGALADDPELYGRLSEGAERLAEAHRLDRVGAHLCRLYDSVVTGVASEVAT